MDVSTPIKNVSRIGGGILLLILLASVEASSKTLICGIPDKSNKRQGAANYTKLTEPKTIIVFDQTDKVSKFNSPGCHKFQTIARWTNKFIITCASNNAETIKLRVNTVDLKFNKTYFKEKHKQRTAKGFCKRSTY